MKSDFTNPCRRPSEVLRLTTIAMLACLLLAPLLMAAGKGPRILPAGKKPDDVRLKPLKDLNGYFPFEVPATRKQWQRRAQRVRQQMLVSLGLWPMPKPTPLHAVIADRRVLDGYSIEKVHFQSFPGFYVTGSLYRPLNPKGRVPGVLSPHGHWNQGRFYDAGDKTAKQQIEQGAEKLDNAAHSPLQARCVQLARMGCVVFHYDMIGYADCNQISFQVAHRFAKQRPDMNQANRWGLFSPQAESHLQSVMGLQSYNSVRALDFISSLPDVDSKRIAVTGASGGGTQTFVLAAIDPRPALAFPAVMVSTAMQGGCTCENASLFRVGTGNVEFAALFAPKPLGVTAANDWTKEMKSKGFPELRKLYDMLGAKNKVTLLDRTEFGHNYNLVSRTAMYDWINKHFKLGHKTPIAERDFPYQSPQQLTVWNQKSRPKGGREFERNLLQAWRADAVQQMAQTAPSDKASLRRYRHIAGNGIDAVIGRQLPETGAVEFDQMHKVERPDHLEIGGLLRHRAHGEELPMIFLYPKEWNKKVVIWLSSEGKSGLYDASGKLKASIARLVDDGNTVVGVDLFQQGEFGDGKKLTQTRRVKNTREAAAYTFGYNATVLNRRVHDALSVIAYVRDHEYTPERVSLLAMDETAPIAIAARAQARDAVHRLAVDTKGFRFGKVGDIHSVGFLPGGAKYDDVVGMMAVAAPAAVWVAGEGDKGPSLLRAAYRAAGANDRLTVFTKSNPTAAAIKWVME